MAERKFYDIKNLSSDVAEIYIYDEIGAGLWSEGVTAKAFVEDLAKVNAKQIDLRLNSPGGSVRDGMAIYNALDRHPAKITTYIDGLAASMASMIALVGDQVVMAEGSLFMIHNPWVTTAGNAEELRKAADILDKIRESSIGIYMKKFKGTEEELMAALDAETWYSAQEAVDAGFATSISSQTMKIAASFDVSKYEFRNLPQALTESTASIIVDVQPIKETVMSENIEFDVRALADEVAEVRRMVEAGTPEPVASAPVFRSAAEVLKSMAKGDELAIRAYTGATTADTVIKDGWVGDLTRIVDQPAILRGVFASAVLPGEGNNIEYASLDSDNTDVQVQAAEGDDLVTGKIVISSKTAPVKTLGGYVQLSRQVIERSSIAYLQHSLRAQALKVGVALEAQVRVAYETAHAAQVTAGNVVTIPASPTYTDWLNAITDASLKFQDYGLAIDALIVDTAYFKSLMALEGADGRPMLLVQGSGNVVGDISPNGLRATLAGIPVVLAPAVDGIAFVSSQAIRQYNTPVVQLQDENIINLSKDFSVYTYTAVANEIPAGIVPVVVD